MNATQYLSGVYLDDHTFIKKDVIWLMEDYHKYKVEYKRQEEIQARVNAYKELVDKDKCKCQRPYDKRHIDGKDECGICGKVYREPIENKMPVYEMSNEQIIDKLNKIFKYKEWLSHKELSEDLTLYEINTYIDKNYLESSLIQDVVGELSYRRLIC